MKIAFDIGGVIVNKDNSEPNIEAYLSIKMFVQKFKSENIFIISKAKNKWIALTHELFEKTNFYKETNFDKKNLYFVDEYVDKQTLCKKLEINYMVDDNIKVIKYMLEINTIPIWFSPSQISYLDKQLLKKIIIANNWKTIRKIMQKIKII